MDCSVVSAVFPVFKQLGKILLIQSLIKSKVIYFILGWLLSPLQSILRHNLAAPFVARTTP